jgi:hypothetical protein
LNGDINLTYIGMWNFSDDYGVIKGSAVWIQKKIFPYRDVDINTCLKALEDLHKLIPFEVEGVKYYFIKNFLKIQKVEKPSKTRNPTPPVDILERKEESATRPLPDSSPTTPQLVGDEVKLSEVKRSEVKKSEANVSELKERESERKPTADEPPIVPAPSATEPIFKGMDSPDISEELERLGIEPLDISNELSINLAELYAARDSKKWEKVMAKVSQLYRLGTYSEMTAEQRVAEFINQYKASF